MKKNNKKGFTLVELVIVVAVMAVLVAVAIPTVQSITGTAKSTVAETNARTIESTIKLAEANKSKEGDVVLALTADEIDTALTNAKLGIESGKYVYDATKGTVTVAESAGAGQFLITFDAKAANANDAIVVTAGV